MTGAASRRIVPVSREGDTACPCRRRTGLRNRRAAGGLSEAGKGREWTDRKGQPIFGRWWEKIGLGLFKIPRNGAGLRDFLQILPVKNYLTFFCQN